MNQVDDWLERLIEEKGEDLYRMKGVLSVEGSDQRYVFQVHIFFYLPFFNGIMFLVYPFIIFILFIYFMLAYSSSSSSSGSAFGARRLPGKYMGTGRKEDKQACVHRKEFG